MNIITIVIINIVKRTLIIIILNLRNYFEVEDFWSNTGIERCNSSILTLVTIRNTRTLITVIIVTTLISIMKLILVISLYYTEWLYSVIVQFVTF